MIQDVAPKSKSAELLTSFASSLVGAEKAVKPASSGMSSFLQKLPMLRKK
jgi:Flp pilus assembly CpaE family ATPase